MAAIPVQVQEVGSTEGSQQQRKKKFSTFLVTINTQRVPRTQPEVDRGAEELRGIMRQMLTSEGLGRIVKFLTPGHAWQPEYIDDIKAEFSIEIGERFGRLHTHALIEMAHFSKIHLDRVGIQGFFAGEASSFTDKPHVDIRVVRGAQNARQYVGKKKLVPNPPSANK